MRNPFLIAALIVCTVAPAVSEGNAPQSARPYTSFQTPTPYMPENDLRTDAVILYSADPAAIKSWADKGYIVQTMYGFRVGEDYIKKHPEEGQTTADGTILTCGPGSYYMVPAPNRVKAAIDYFTQAINGSTTAVIPEEPEFFAIAGYSESFKKAWRDYYKEPWRDPASSIEARYKSERLKARMELDMVKAILDSAQKQKSSVTRMVAFHSPVNYHSWGIVFPHYQCLMLPSLQEIIGQVWTGTARTPCLYEGVMAERTFENALLEYSSLYNLARGTGKRMWFLMDPLEDNLERSMEDYHINYEKTLIASLMYPEIDSYEVMPWPTRIFGRVPDSYATLITTVVNALGDVHNQTSASFDTGTRGIATFVADSMGWQRAWPGNKSFDGFYGMTLPLVMRGIPIQIAQLERVVQPGYLKPYKVLLVSYDLLKPMNPKINQALADWVKRGGVMVFFGGSDAYNAVPEWWRKAGFASPQADLYARLGVSAKLRSVSRPDSIRELGRAKKRFKALENHRVYTYRLKPAQTIGNRAYITFRDAFPDDGWGAFVTNVRFLNGSEVIASFRPGTEQEKAFLLVNRGSQTNEKGRFADRDAYWTYSFDLPRGGSPAIQVEMGNQFVVELSEQAAKSVWNVIRSARNPLTAKGFSLAVPYAFPLTLADVTTGEHYHLAEQLGSVVFEKTCGKGKLIHVGIDPAYFASSGIGSRMLRAFVAYACDRARLEYREQQWMAIRRGVYVAVKTFEGTKQLRGRYVNLLDAKLSVLNDPSIEPNKEAFLCDVTSKLISPGPVLLYSSSKVESKIENPDLTVLRLSGPLKTRGCCRVFAAGRTVASITPEQVKHEVEQDTVLLRYDNLPESVTIEIKWR
jgi:hypothetical protein